MKPSINRRYHSLCSPSIDMGVYVFGDRMSDMQEIAEAAKVSREIVASSNGGANNTASSNRH